MKKIYIVPIVIIIVAIMGLIFLESSNYLLRRTVNSDFEQIYPNYDLESIEFTNSDPFSPPNVNLRYYNEGKSQFESVSWLYNREGWIFKKYERVDSIPEYSVDSTGQVKFKGYNL